MQRERMLGRLKIGVVAAAAVLTLMAGVMWVMPAYAQEAQENHQATEATSEATTSPTELPFRQRLREQVHQAGVDAAAEVLGMTPQAVADALWGGETLADLAEAAHVPLSQVREAMQRATSTVRDALIRDFITQRVEDGQMSQARADWIFEGMDNNWFGLGRVASNFDGLGHDRFGVRE